MAFFFCPVHTIKHASLSARLLFRNTCTYTISSTFSRSKVAAVVALWLRHWAAKHDVVEWNIGYSGHIFIGTKWKNSHVPCIGRRIKSPRWLKILQSLIPHYGAPPNQIVVLARGHREFFFAQQHKRQCSCLTALLARLTTTPDTPVVHGTYDFAAISFIQLTAHACFRKLVYWECINFTWLYHSLRDNQFIVSGEIGNEIVLIFPS